MSFVGFELIERGPVPGILKRDLNKLAKVSWIAAGRFWHAKLRRKHFTKTGAAEYGYRRRTSEYLRRKRKSKGHIRPLDWTGRSRRSTRIRDVRGTSKGVSVVMRAPTLNFRPRGWDHTMRTEMTTVSRKEEQQIAGVYETTLDKLIERIRGATSVRINL